jgi:hypothetical protein
MFITMVQGGSGARPLYGTTTPNPDGADADALAESNFYYINDDDELTVHNLNAVNSITLGGSTITTWPSGGGGSFDGTATNTVTTGSIVFNDNAKLYFGTGSDFEVYENGSGLYIDGNDDTHDITIRDSSNAVVAGFDMGTKGFVCGGDGTFTGDVTTNSDMRLKENVNVISNALDIIDNLRGVSYNRIDKERKEIGLIAQEVEEILPEVVRTGTDDEQLKSVAYGNITAVLIEAIKELKSEIEQLKK